MGYRGIDSPFCGNDLSDEGDKVTKKNNIVGVILSFMLIYILALTAGCGQSEVSEISDLHDTNVVSEQNVEQQIPEQEESVPPVDNTIQNKKEEQIVENVIPPSKPKVSYIGGKPRLAIVIDDLGEGLASTKELFKLSGYPLTVAVMPRVSNSAKEATEAAEKGFCVIMHQPMQPISAAAGLGAGAITTDMSDEEILAVMRANFDILPNVVGVNNHMGSKVTSDYRTMKVILEEIQRRGLFFFDSMTTGSSVVTKVAESLGMKILINVKFLDHENTEEYVTEAIMDAVNMAEQRGYAVVIGHTRKATISALTKILPQLVEMGVELVTLEDLMNDAALDTTMQFVPVKKGAPSSTLPIVSENTLVDEGVDEINSQDSQQISLL